MKHHRAHDLEWGKAAEEHFTGRVWMAPMSRQEGPISVAGVLFEPAARSDWHSHPEGQVLYVVSGAGRVQDEDGTVVEVGPGDVVHAAPGRRHWHGAAPGSYLMHLAVTTGAPTEWSGPKVSDEEYERASSE